MRLKIGFLLPAVDAIGNIANGVRVQAMGQAAALRRLGHEVRLLSPWEQYGAGRLDILQFFQGGPSAYCIESLYHSRYRRLVFAPIIDSNHRNITYRIAAAIGSASRRVMTIPGMLRQQCVSSNLIICRSTHEQERVVSGLGIQKSKTRIVLNGVSDLTQTPVVDVRRKFGLPDEFVLHVSAYSQERKNAINMVRALAETDMPIVLAGAASAGTVLQDLESMSAKADNIYLLGYVDQDDLRALYDSCTVFCLPSHHEGTGLSALEAAASGARVVITKHGGPKDYFLDMAEYVDPTEQSNIRNATVRAWNGNDSGKLRDHVLSNLTWDCSAAQLERAYESII